MEKMEGQLNSRACMAINSEGGLGHSKRAAGEEAHSLRGLVHHGDSVKTASDHPLLHKKGSCSPVVPSS